MNRGDNAVVQRISTITRYFRAVSRFKRDLYVLVHPSIGRPWCESEGPTLQYRNSAGSDSRSIFISNSIVQFTTGYHKEYRYSGQPKIIHRFASKKVSKLVVYYLWLGELFMQIMQGIRNQQREFSPFLQEPNPQVGKNKDKEDKAQAELKHEETGKQNYILEQLDVVVDKMNKVKSARDDDEVFLFDIRYGRA